ncbi:Uu.00g016960.m01.CDS01 [Anthostomella pinea]|uniref:Uu.00g016960.m01.CDS01 n=1 Tax=Anthostomella pinea TaxID=933095 RepID=A0AAI8YNB9_9PEZI|nr:Uu.00g016960.m01.CDS01 [Anthostomella pinea]
MAANNMHPYNPGFSPFMMPINGNPFATLPSPMQAPVQVQQAQQGGGHQNPGPSAQPAPRKTDDSAHDPKNSPKNSPAESGAPSSPVKPPSSLIQPTYRKHSPNLIVDVAETCQEKFPFKEVAERHDTSVEKVFDVFAAIIKVPLLRCPTDRRRPGKLATTRVKEYTKAKKDLQESRAQVAPGAKQDYYVTPSTIAQSLGRVEFPEGFKFGQW